MSKPVRLLALSREDGMGESREANCALYAGRIAKHSAFNPDVIVFTEHATGLGTGMSVAELAEPGDGPSMRFFARMARENGAWIVGGFYLAVEPGDAGKGAAYNAAALLDRAGRTAGIYRKTYPTGYEYSAGVAPGPASQAPFPSEFGLVGLAICYDSGFPEIWDAYGRAGARIVFWPSAYPGGAVLDAHAVRNGFYIVTATHPPSMRVIDPLGHTVAACAPDGRALEATIDLDEEYVHMDYANLVVKDIRGKYGAGIEIEEHGEIGWYRFRRKAGPELVAVLAEYGLVPVKEFYARERRDIDRQRATGDGPRHGRAW